jgi:hypothetical protein
MADEAVKEWAIMAIVRCLERARKEGNNETH